MSFPNYLHIVQIIVSAALILVTLLQAKGTDIGSAFGGSGGRSAFRTRRGIEKTLFQLTIVLVVVFILISIWSVQATPSTTGQ